MFDVGAQGHVMLSAHMMQVEEKDDVWTPETLLIQLASELNLEMEKAEGRAKEAATAKT